MIKWQQKLISYIIFREIIFLLKTSKTENYIGFQNEALICKKLENSMQTGLAMNTTYIKFIYFLYSQDQYKRCYKKVLV